jgi:hypothetical protein
MGTDAWIKEKKALSLHRAMGMGIHEESTGVPKCAGVVRLGDEDPDRSAIRRA